MKYIKRYYFLIGYIWGLIAEFIRLQQTPDISFVEAMLFFILDLIMWPISMAIQFLDKIF